MKNGKYQCKDIPDAPILEFLAGLDMWGSWFDPKYENSVLRAMPPYIPPKLAHAKMCQLMHRGVVSGCNCGCRGDFELTTKGLALLEVPNAQL